MSKLPPHSRQLVRDSRSRELSLLLQDLDQRFQSWRDGDLESGELANRIHEFSKGPLRELEKCYSALDEATLIARAVVNGILPESELGPELLVAIESRIAALKDLRNG